ncbi:hypothetical protein LIER_00899 [Lithospermum erythrorhizon]|uniref:Uncharacterized protein n=1 Tax=Lithospermum erythrorhizon TaxID=34254 RepID=A0AAV3NK65_LITER
MLSEVTKKNVDIMGIIGNAGVMPTVEIVGPYYPKLVRDFICNMTDDIDDPESPNFQKGIHVADIPLRVVEIGNAFVVGNGETARYIRDEIKHLDGVIQTSLARKSVLEARLRSLTGEVDPEVDPDVADNEAKASQN